MPPPYDALTIDANVVIRDGYNFEGGLLGQLSQFKGGAPDFILSEVVLREIQKHLHKATRSVSDALQSAGTKALRYGVVGAADAALVSGALDRKIDPAEAARLRLVAFGAATGVKLVAADKASVKEVIELYFRSTPPFASAGNKKEEFPDGIALVSLQNWARESGKKILAVSDDRGWAEFAEGSDCIDVVGELGEALGIFQQHAERATAAVKQLLAVAESGDAPDFMNELEYQISSEVGGIMVDPEVDSPFTAEVDQVDLEYKGLMFGRSVDGFDVTVVRAGSDEIVAQIGAGIDVEAEAWFSLSVFDSVDKDRVYIGGAWSRVATSIETDILITLAGDISGPVTDLELAHVELVENFVSIDFGSVDMNSAEDREELYEELPQLPFDEPAAKDASDT